MLHNKPPPDFVAKRTYSCMLFYRLTGSSSYRCSWLGSLTWLNLPGNSAGVSWFSIIMLTLPHEVSHLPGPLYVILFLYLTAWLGLPHSRAAGCLQSKWSKRNRKKEAKMSFSLKSHIPSFHHILSFRNKSLSPHRLSECGYILEKKECFRWMSFRAFSIKLVQLLWEKQKM